MTKAEFEFIVNHITEQLISSLMEDYGMSMSDAFDKVYASETYQKLHRQSTGLYRYSSGYTYQYLLKELA